MAIFNRLVQPNLITIYTCMHTYTRARAHTHKITYNHTHTRDQIHATPTQLILDNTKCMKFRHLNIAILNRVVDLKFKECVRYQRTFQISPHSILSPIKNFQAPFTPPYLGVRNDRYRYFHFYKNYLEVSTLW